MTLHDPHLIDPFDLLVSMRDPAVDRPLAPGDDPTADALLEDILAGGGAPEAPPRPRWGRRAVGGALVVALAGGGAVAAARLLADPSDPVALSCYSEPSSDPAIQVGLVIDPSTTPKAQCAPLWSDGTLGSDGAPQLASCVADTGITAVIPGTGDTCVEIGYDERAPSDGSPNVAAEITNAISDTWAARHDEGECVRSIDEATAMLEQVIDDADAEGWTIRVVQDITPDMPCAGAGVDPQARELFISALPDLSNEPEVSDDALAAAATLGDAIEDTWRVIHEEGECIRSIDEATAMLEQIIDDADAESWSIRVEHDVTPDMPCVGPGVDPGARELVISAFADEN